MSSNLSKKYVEWVLYATLAMLLVAGGLRLQAQCSEYLPLYLIGIPIGSLLGKGSARPPIGVCLILLILSGMLFVFSFKFEPEVYLTSYSFLLCYIVWASVSLARFKSRHSARRLTFVCERPDSGVLWIFSIVLVFIASMDLKDAVAGVALSSREIGSHGLAAFICFSHLSSMLVSPEPRELEVSNELA